MFPFKLLIAIWVLAEHISSHFFDRTYWLALRKPLCFLWDRWQLPIFAHWYLLALSITFAGELGLALIFFFSFWAVLPYNISLKRNNKMTAYRIITLIGIRRKYFLNEFRCVIKVVFFELFPVSCCLEFILEGYSWLLQKQVHPNEEARPCYSLGFSEVKTTNVPRLYLYSVTLLKRSQS